MATVRVQKLQRTVGRARPASNVGLHLPTGDHLLPEDRSRHWWHAHGHQGLRDVVCLDCHTSGDSDSWLVFAEGDVQRAHLRHLHVTAETPGVHSGETWWHTAAKSRLASWAAALTNVDEVHVEHLLPRVGDHGRRPDVLVLVDQRWVTLEIQQSALEARRWALRSNDARDAGYLPVWLFAPHNRPLLDQTAQMDAASCLIFDLELDEIGLLVRTAAPTGPGWWNDPRADLTRYVDRSARPGDRPDRIHYVPLGDCGLDRQGIVLPPGVVPSEDTTSLARLAAEKRAVAKRLADWRENQAKAKRDRRGASHDQVYDGDPPASYVPPAAPGARLCVLCGDELSEFYGPGEDRHLPSYNCHLYHRR